MSDSDVMTDMLILSEKLARKDLQTCEVCGESFRKVCISDSCRLARNDAATRPQLKLFKVTVSVLKDYPMVGDREGIDTYILDVDGPSAEGVVLSGVNWALVDPNKMVETEEIKGPFKAGHILFSSEF